MPAQFSRPRIELDGGRRVRRTWRTILAADIKVGDIIPGVGRVHDVDEIHTLDAATPWTVTVTGGDGNWKTFGGQEEVFIFTGDTP